MADPFAGMSETLDSPYMDGAAVTPSDSVDLAGGTSKGIYVGGVGALKVTTARGTDLTFAAVPAGTTIRLRVTRVWSTGTAATSIVALY